MDCAEMGEIFNDLLLEFRWFSWNPYHEASILLADDITAVLSQEDRTSDLFRASLVHEVSSTDLEAVVKFVVDFFNTDLFYFIWIPIAPNMKFVFESFHGFIGHCNAAILIYLFKKF